jgi:hypothetical protein
MTLDQEDIQAIVKAVRESLQIPSPAPLDSVHQVQQQAMQLLKEGKREESKALLKAYSQRERRKSA